MALYSMEHREASRSKPMLITWGLCVVVSQQNALAEQHNEELLINMVYKARGFGS